MYHSLLIHSSADGHLGCFHVLVFVNSAAMNIGIHVSLSILVSSVCMPSRGGCWVVWQFILALWKIFEMCPTTVTELTSDLALSMGFSRGSVVNNSSASVEGLGLIPRSRRSPGERNEIHSSILAWEISRTEDPGGLQSTGSQKSWTRCSD